MPRKRKLRFFLMVLTILSSFLEICGKIHRKKRGDDYDYPAGGGKEVELASQFIDMDNSRIVGGTEATPNEFPSVVKMLGRSCAGTIISEDYVLTAAHCVKENVPANYEFAAGKHDLNKMEDSQQNVTATEIVVHPKYRNTTLRSDIALFKVQPQFKFNDYVKPAKIPSFHFDRLGDGTVVGWGQTCHNCSESQVLRKVVIPLMTNDRCIKYFYPSSRIFNTSLCAGEGEGKDACGGDSGGPLYLNYKGEPLLVGIVSWGRQCGTSAGVYTRVALFRFWIMQYASIPKSKTCVGRKNS